VTDEDDGADPAEACPLLLKLWKAHKAVDDLRWEIRAEAERRWPSGSAVEWEARHTLRGTLAGWRADPEAGCRPEDEGAVYCQVFVPDDGDGGCGVFRLTYADALRYGLTVVKPKRRGK
jgi:hypothetical protein